MRWDDVRIFLEVYRTGSLTQAARSLQTTQATISRRIAGLEDAFGRALFVRTPEGTAPTDLARHLLPSAEAMETASVRMNTVRDSFGQELQGSVRLATTEDVCANLMIPLLAPFRRLHPRLRIEFVTGQGLVDLTRLQADIAIRTVRPTQGDLIIKRLTSTSGQIFGSKAYADTHGEKPPTQWDWIGWGSDQHYMPEERWLKEHLPQVEPVLRANSMQVRRSAVLNNLGVTILPRDFALLFDGLAPMPHALPQMPRYATWIIAHATLHKEPRVKAVWDFIVNQDHGAFKTQGSHPPEHD